MAINDAVTARAFLTMQRRWTGADYQALCELVKRNELIGSVLGREGYIVMQQLAWAVGGLLLAERDARDQMALAPDPTAAALVRR